jgi:phosphoglycolate phosphatase
MTNARFKAVLFDLDGTLLDTLQDIADSANAALREMALPTHQTDEYRAYIGEGREVLASRALPPDRRDPASVERMLAVMNSEYTRRWPLHTRPYEGIPELLDVLTARAIKMAVLSNKAHEFTERMVSQTLPLWRFTAVVGAMDGTPKKPHPDAALRIARRLRVPPAGFIYLGDSAIDMQTAVAAGMFPCGALWGFRSREELVEGGVRELLARPIDLLRLL